MITEDRGFSQCLGPDFGFWLLESSDRVSQRSHRNLTFSLLYVQAGEENDIGYINVSLIVILNAKTQYHTRQLQLLKSLCISCII